MPSIVAAQGLRQFLTLDPLSECNPKPAPSHSLGAGSRHPLHLSLTLWVEAWALSNQGNNREVWPGRSQMADVTATVRRILADDRIEVMTATNEALAVDPCPNLVKELRIPLSGR